MDNQITQKTLYEKKLAFNLGNRQGGKSIQNRLNKEIKSAKRAYKDRVERLFNNGKPRDAWLGVKTLAGLPTNSTSTGLPPEVSASMAEELNTFYCRSDQCDFTNEREELMAEPLYMFKYSAIWKSSIICPVAMNNNS